MNFEQITSKYSERLYLCLNNYQCNLNSNFNHLFHSLNVLECTLGYQYISVTLYLLQTYPSEKPLFKGQVPVNLTSSKKWESSKKTHKNKLKLVTEVEEPKTSSFVKPRRWNSFIVKFQNLKQIVIIRANQKKINVKNNIKQIKSNFFYRKFWNKSYQNFSTKLLGSWEI